MKHCGIKSKSVPFPTDFQVGPKKDTKERKKWRLL